MGDKPLVNLSPTRILEAVAAIPPLSKTSYFEEHFYGRYIRVAGRVTLLLDSLDAMVQIENESDGAKVTTSFDKPVSPELHLAKIGDFIVVTGRVTSFRSDFLMLTECSLERVDYHSLVPASNDTATNDTVADASDTVPNGEWHTVTDSSVANISLARMVNELASIAPLARESHLKENFLGLRVRAEGVVTLCSDILHGPYATIMFKNQADGVMVHANFTKPVPPEVKQFREGDRIAVVGVVFNVADSVVLDDCSLVESQDAQLAKRRLGWADKWWGNLTIQTAAALIATIVGGLIVAYFAWRYFHN